MPRPLPVTASFSSQPAARALADHVPLGSHALLEEGGLVVKDGQLGIGRFYSDVANWYGRNPRTRALEPVDASLP